MGLFTKKDERTLEQRLLDGIKGNGMTMINPESIPTGSYEIGTFEGQGKSEKDIEGAVKQLIGNLFRYGVEYIDASSLKQYLVPVTLGGEQPVKVSVRGYKVKI